MNYEKLFSGAKDFIENNFSVVFEINYAPKATRETISEVENAIGTKLPKHLEEFYLNFADGVEIYFLTDKLDDFDGQSVCCNTKIAGSKDRKFIFKSRYSGPLVIVVLFGIQNNFTAFHEHNEPIESIQTLSLTGNTVRFYG